MARPIKHISAALLAGLAILLAQVGVAIWQHLGSTRYFAWAPNDYLVTYDLRAGVGGRALTPGQISRRYRLNLTNRRENDLTAKAGLAPSEHYVWEDPPQHLFDRIKWYEQTYGLRDPARVVLTYQLDGGPIRVWRWPQ